MDKEYDMNISEEINDVASLTDYSTSLVMSSFESHSDIYNRNNQYSNYRGMNFPPTSNNFISDMYNNQGSSQDWNWMLQNNEVIQQDFLKYIDKLTSYLYKQNPEALEYLENNINKYKNGEFVDMERITPLLFPEMHALAKLDFPGLIYQLIPSFQTGGTIEITDEIYPKYYVFRSDDYPGPLNLERTTEDDVYCYLTDQMSSDHLDTVSMDWDSEHLLMQYLALMIKENGKPRSSNIVRLLNAGIETKTFDLKTESKQFDSISRNSFSRASSRATSRASSRAASPEKQGLIDFDLPQNTLEYPRGPGSVASVMRRAVTNLSQDQKLCQNMDKFREYIWSGRFDEALNFAVRSEIWDHAFALALRMDNNATLINDILVRFSRRAVSQKDPLFTMYELMASKSPRIVATNIRFTNSEMSDWRCHLSMIEAVRKYRPTECRQAIESMGEKLLYLRNYFGAHLCFLLAATSFGIDKNVQKYRRNFDLIGWYSSTSTIPAQKSTYDKCHKLFTGHNYWLSAPEQYIKLTEIYEYALKLRDDNSHRSLSVHLLPYKYLMAYRMFERHQSRKAYDYCRNIGEILGYEGVDWLRSEYVTFRIVSNIRVLSYQLHSLLTSDENFTRHDTLLNDQKWLNNIDQVYCQLCQKYNFWNPMGTQTDFFINRFIEIDEESECVSDACSNIKQEYPPPNNFNYQQFPGDFHQISQTPQIETPVYNPQNTNFQASQVQQNEIQNQSSQMHYSQEHNQNQNLKQQNQNDNQNTIFQQHQIQNPYSKFQATPVQSNQAQIHNVTYRPTPIHLNQILNPQQTQVQSNDQTSQSIQNRFKEPSQPSIANNLIIPPPPSNLPVDMISTSPPFQMPNNYPKPISFLPDGQKEEQTSNKLIDGQSSQSVLERQFNKNATNQMFMPISDNGNSNDSCDPFKTTRLRTQSNSSDQKEQKIPEPPPPLPSKKELIKTEEPKKTKKDEVKASTEKKKGWGLFNVFKGAQGVNLPDDSESTFKFDPVKNRWVDTSNPDDDRPPTPPPLMSEFKAQAFTSMPGLNNQSTLSKYRQPTIKVKKSSVDIPAPSLPSLRTTQVSNTQYNGQERIEGPPLSRSAHNPIDYSNHMNGFNGLPQSTDSSSTLHANDD